MLFVILTAIMEVYCLWQILKSNIKFYFIPSVQTKIVLKVKSKGSSLDLDNEPECHLTKNVTALMAVNCLWQILK